MKILIIKFCDKSISAFVSEYKIVRKSYKDFNEK